jgi:hypothetical protein
MSTVATSATTRRLGRNRFPVVTLAAMERVAGLLVLCPPRHNGCHSFCVVTLALSRRPPRARSWAGGLLGGGLDPHTEPRPTGRRC